jgi:hypothetical protein
MKYSPGPPKNTVFLDPYLVIQVLVVLQHAEEY